MRTHLPLALLLGLLLLPHSLFSQDSFSSTLRASQQRGEAIYSALVAKLETSEVLDQFQADRALIPASTVKLITTASATKLLPEYPFITNFAISGEVIEGVLYGDLLIEGMGDPSLFSKYFPLDSIRFRESLIASLRSYKIDSLAGGVEVNASAFETKGFNPLWEEEDKGEWYGCGVYGFNIFDNWIKLTFTTSKSGTRPQLVDTYPRATPVELVNQLRTVRRNAYAYTEGAELSNRRILKGSLYQHRKEATLSIDLPHPPQFGALFITSLLRENGIGVRDSARYSFAPAERVYKLVGQYYAPRLEDLIRICNVHSLNHYAEALLKRIAWDEVKPATSEAGVNRIATLWQDLPLSAQFRLVDGSGLSRHNRLTASDLYHILGAMAQDQEHFPSFIQSLAEAGSEGTVRGFLKGRPYTAYLKSGAMRGVQCYAGYIVSPKGNYIVVLLANNVKNRSKTRKAMQEAIEKVIL